VAFMALFFSKKIILFRFTIFTTGMSSLIY